MSHDVLGIDEADEPDPAVVGGKGARLGELSRIEGVRVPAGFFVTTRAFRQVMADATSIDEHLDRLSRLEPRDLRSIGELSTRIRAILENAPMPAGLAAAITGEIARLGEAAAYAVRSSATAEDLPTASFAGQQDTYLNVVGPSSILEHVSRCWASLFTERAVMYRLQHGIDHRKVHMAVVVQRMVFPEAAGILFTADPVTGNRAVTSIEATFGLGEALVSGLVNPDVYKVRDGAVVARAIATKAIAIVAAPAGGTQERAIEPQRQRQPALTDEQVIALARLGRRIEAHFGGPQDIEWCLVDDGFQVVQSRPITTLFPIPAAGDEEYHVYLSVGHQQMMTDPMKPLGLSVWQATALRPMVEAGGRLFVDVTRDLASAAGRAGILEAAGRSDPLTRDALQTILDRGDLDGVALREGTDPAPPARGPASIATDPTIVADLINDTEASIAALKRNIRAHSGSALLDFILADIGELRRLLVDPRSRQAVMAGMEATWWLNDHLQAWLGERSAADTLTLSAPNNVTAEMGLALLDVADVIRPHPEVVAALEHVDDDGFLEALDDLPGGPEARTAIGDWLDTYGMRGVGEIDITRPRWIERPSTLAPLILANVRSFEPGEGRRRLEQGRQTALAKEQELLGRLRALPDGEQKAAEVKGMIDRVRAFIGFREYPKYGIVSRYLVYKQALLDEARRLMATRVLREPEDIFYLTFQELQDVVRTNHVDDLLIGRRKELFASYRALTPPRVLTSDGEVVEGAYRRNDVPEGALVGLAVSAGTVEGRARIILDMAAADLDAGDILVTACTDPSWTPLFVGIKGLVTEVGGLMTHGAVIAREYGLPAVVGVEHATRLIRDGQRIRVHGTDGFVELLA